MKLNKDDGYSSERCLIGIEASRQLGRTTRTADAFFWGVRERYWERQLTFAKERSK